MATYICTHCGWEGERKKQLRGSKMVSMLIWSILLIPGPFYSIWRHTGRKKECPHCSFPMLVKITSDAGQLARRKFDIELGILAPLKKEAKNDDPLASFGNERVAAPSPRSKPVNPEEW